MDKRRIRLFVAGLLLAILVAFGLHHTIKLLNRVEGSTRKAYYLSDDEILALKPRAMRGDESSAKRLFYHYFMFAETQDDLQQAYLLCDLALDRGWLWVTEYEKERIIEMLKAWNSSPCVTEPADSDTSKNQAR